MPSIIWWIILVGFVAPAVVLLGLFIANRYSKGNPGKTMGALWLVLLVMLVLFLGFGIFQGAK
jgi:hypothetical protein